MIAKCSIYARYSGRPVCRGMRPVGREEGILVVEWSLTGTATHCFGPEFRRRRVVRNARSDQSALVMPWRLYFSQLLAYCIVSILNSILWTLYSVVYDSKVIAHGSIWGEVPCIPDHPVHVGSTPSNPSIHIYPRITIKINNLYSHSWRNPYVLLSGMYVLIVCGAQSGRGPERMGQDQMIRTCRDFLSEYITIVALVILCWLPHICITPLLGSVAGGER